MMNASPIYVVISIAVLAIVAILVSSTRKGGEVQRFTPLAGLAFAFVLAGILFGSDRLIGYSLLGIGVVLAVVDIFAKLKNK
jgi:hypothetical protein